MPERPHRTLHVSPSQGGDTVAKALRSLAPDLSWSKIKKLFVQRRVQLNGNLCVDETRLVKHADVIRISAEPVELPRTTDDVGLVYVDEHVVVVEKPAGVNTLRHSEERDWSKQRKQSQPTLNELVDELLAGTPSANRSPTTSTRLRNAERHRPRVRAVHRLDRDTSGLLLFARTVQAEIDLIRQFKKHTVDRAYLAIVPGNVAAQTIESWLVRDRGDGLRGSTSAANAPDAQRAVTHVRPLELLTNYTVVECRLETGRTHQIRIHMAEQGHVLCGEKVYSHALGGSAQVDRSGAKRQALHAAVLGFTHPHSRELLQFVSPLPADLQNLLARLRKER